LALPENQLAKYDPFFQKTVPTLLNVTTKFLLDTSKKHQLMLDGFSKKRLISLENKTRTYEG
jgi:hypothetical protein